MLGVVIAVLGGLALVAAARVIIAVLGWILKLVFGTFSIFNHND